MNSPDSGFWPIYFASGLRTGKHSQHCSTWITSTSYTERLISSRIFKRPPPRMKISSVWRVTEPTSLDLEFATGGSSRYHSKDIVISHNIDCYVATSLSHHCQFRGTQISGMLSTSSAFTLTPSIRDNIDQQHIYMDNNNYH